MIQVKIHLEGLSKVASKMKALQNPKNLLRDVAFDVLSLMDERIHNEGKAADDSQIGTYNSSYLKLRQNKYKRTADKKITVSLTRRLQNDWGVIDTERGWGIGFLNRQKGTSKEPDSSDKMKYVEQQKGKKIASLTKSEKDYAITKFKKLVQAKLNEK